MNPPFFIGPFISETVRRKGKHGIYIGKLALNSQ